MNLYIVYAIAYVGLGLVIPTCYVVLKRRYTSVTKSKAWLIAFAIYLGLCLFSSWVQTSPQHFFVITAFITAFTWMIFLHHVDLMGSWYNHVVESFRVGNKSTPISWGKRNLYYALFTYMLFRGNFYCGVTQFYKLFGHSLKAYQISLDTKDRVNIADDGVMFLKLGDRQVPLMRWVTAYNFTENHCVVPFQSHFDRGTGLQIILHKISRPKFHWLKLFFRP